MPLAPLALASFLLLQPPAGQKTPVTTIAARPPEVKLPANVVVRINGVDISRDELMGTFQLFGGRELASRIAQKTLVEAEAKRLGVTITDAEVTAKIGEEKAKTVRNAIQAYGEPIDFAGVQKRIGLTEGEVAWSIRLNLLARKTFLKSLESQVPSLKGQRRLAHILIATIPLDASQPPLTPEQQKEKEAAAKTKIDQIMADIKAGKTTFEEAAKQFSEDRGPDGKSGSAAQGGALPWVGRGALDPAFEKAAFSLTKAGDVTEPVKSQFGWHLIKLLKKGESATPDETKKYRDEQIGRDRDNPQAFQAWLATLMRSAKITFNPEAQARMAPPARRTTKKR